MSLPAAGAQIIDQPDPGAERHPRIVRLSYVEGSVRILRGDATEFKQAYQNMPLIEGTRVETGDDGRAEMEFEDGSLIRLAPDTAVSLDQLARQSSVYISAVRLLSGLTYLELRSSRRYSYLVTYPDGEFSPVQNSTVRVNLDVQPADLAVLDGDIRVQKTDAYNVEVRQGESLDGDPADPSRYFLSQTVAPDSWDAWNDDRDQALLAQGQDTTSARDQYAGDVGYGWSELDAYGSWYPVPGYGLMWQPAGESDDFDPYGNGVWAEYPTYGYVWVSAYPWGWTPFQCGGWSYVPGFGWGWMPTVGCGSYAGGWGGGFYGSFRGEDDDEDSDRGHHNNVHEHPGGYRPPQRPIRIAGQSHDGNFNGGGSRQIVAVGQAVAHPTLAPHRGGAAKAPPVEYQGRVLAPLRPVHPSPVAIGGIHSGLVRDYPVNAGSGKPELGVIPVPANGGEFGQQRPAPVVSGRRPGQPNSPAASNAPDSNQPRTVYQPRSTPVPVDRGSQQYPAPSRPVYSQPSRPSPAQGGYSPRPSQPQESRPSAPAPSRPSAPAPSAPASRPAPAVSSPK